MHYFTLTYSYSLSVRFNRNVMVPQRRAKKREIFRGLIHILCYSLCYCCFVLSLCVCCFFFQFRTWPLYHGTRFNKEINSTQKPNNWIIWCGSIFKINFMFGDVFISQENYSFFVRIVQIHTHRRSERANVTGRKKQHRRDEMKRKTTDINAIIFTLTHTHSFFSARNCTTAEFTSSALARPQITCNSTNV